MENHTTKAADLAAKLSEFRAEVAAQAKANADLPKGAAGDLPTEVRLVVMCDDSTKVLVSPAVAEVKDKDGNVTTAAADAVYSDDLDGAVQAAAKKAKFTPSVIVRIDGGAEYLFAQ